MTAKATAILVPVAMTCVCKKCLSLNLKLFSLRISLMSFPKCVAGILKFLKDFVSLTKNSGCSVTHYKLAETFQYTYFSSIHASPSQC